MQNTQVDDTKANRNKVHEEEDERGIKKTLFFAISRPRPYTGKENGKLQGY